MAVLDHAAAAGGRRPMTRRDPERRGPVRRLAAGWNEFWFTPRPTASLALFRIAFGLVATAWTLTLAPNLSAFYGPDGITTEHNSGGVGAWSVLDLSDRPALLYILFAVTVGGGIALTIGLCTRSAAVLVFVGIQSFN